MSTPGGDVKRINTFLELVVNQHGSDLHLVSGQPPRIRLYGDLIPIKYRALSADAQVQQATDERHRDRDQLVAPAREEAHALRSGRLVAKAEVAA